MAPAEGQAPSASSELTLLERESLSAFLPLGSSHSPHDAEGVCSEEKGTSNSKHSHSEREYHHEEHEGHKVKSDSETLRDLHVLRSRQVL